MYTITQIEAIVAQFQDRSLPKEQWTHEAHLVVCCWYLLHYTLDESTCLLRAGIISYNVAVDVENTATRGYHESITLFWIHIIATFLKKQTGDVATKINYFLKSKEANKNLLFQYYSKDLLLSIKGRAIWVAPDLKPLNSRLVSK